MARKKSESEPVEQTELKLTDLPGIGPAGEAKLIEAGYESVLSIAVTSPANIADATGMTEASARKVIKAAREAMSMGFASGLETEDEKKTNGFKISTGCNALDAMLDGGIKSGGITEVFGEWGSGKSQLSHVLAVNALLIRPTAIAVYIDTEGTFTPERIRQIALARKADPDDILSRIRVAKVHTPDHQMFMVEQVEGMFNQKMDIVIVIVDSLTAQFRSTYTGRGTLADRQQKLNKHLRTLQKLGDLHDIPVFVTNQVSSNPGIVYGNPLQAVGGNVVAHAGMERIYLRRGAKGSRVAKLVDSVYLGENEASYIITNNGLEDYE